MARYPNLEEYAKSGKFIDGIKRCDELLKKNPNDVQLLTTKLQLSYASGQDGSSILELLVAVQPPIQDIGEILAIDNALGESLGQIYPPPSTVHPLVSKIWDNAFKTTASVNNKLDLFSYRFSRAIYDNRLVDAQQALIQLKAFQPKNRAVYMAHAAYTQLLSKSKDDLQSRLALSLARKAVTERFDDGDESLDCRVPGQIFALQNSRKDLESVRERRFKDSKQALDALRTSQLAEGKVDLPTSTTIVDPASATPRLWVTSETAALKKIFAKLVAENAEPPVFIAFVSNTVRLFQTAIKSLELSNHRAAAEACFLAISGLVKLFVPTENLDYLLQATHLAEGLLAVNEHVHEARLILVYLYMRLGLGSLAIRLFESLRVKEVQHDTVGHPLFTQLALVHPFSIQFSRRETFDPQDRTLKALAIYKRHEDKLADCEANVLNHAQTGMIFDLQELRSSLRTSLVRRMFVLEHRRIARLTNRKIEPAASERGDIGPRKVANWINSKDNRDFDATFDYGFNVEKVLFEVNGAIPGSDSILCSLAADTAWSLATGKQAPLVTDVEVLLAELETTTNTSPQPRGLTSAELLGCDLMRQVIQLLHQHSRASSTPTALSPDEITGLLAALTNLHVDTLVRTTVPLCEHLHDHYLYIDLLRIVLAACQHLQSTTTPPPGADAGVAELGRVKDVAKRHFLALQKHAQERAASIEADAVRKRLTGMSGDGEQLGVAMQLLGADAARDWTKRVVESAKEGWSGVARVPLP